MPNTPVLSEEFRLGIGKAIVLTLLTCGIYNLFWNARQFRAMNVLLGSEEYRFWRWFLLTIVTCGIYHIYYEYKMGTDLHTYLTGAGRPVNPNLALIALVLSIFGLTIVADAIYQGELNKLTQAG